jgi:hypothetical protein
VQALATRAGNTLTPHDASAANALGLTQQGPVREVYLTSGPSRKLRLGGFEIAVNHAPVLDAGLKRVGRSRRAGPGLDGPVSSRRIAGHVAAHVVVFGVPSSGGAWVCLRGWRGRSVRKPSVAERFIAMSTDARRFVGTWKAQPAKRMASFR